MSHDMFSQSDDGFGYHDVVWLTSIIEVKQGSLGAGAVAALKPRRGLSLRLWRVGLRVGRTSAMGSMFGNMFDVIIYDAWSLHLENQQQQIKVCPPPCPAAGSACLQARCRPACPCAVSMLSLFTSHAFTHRPTSRVIACYSTTLFRDVTMGEAQEYMEMMAEQEWEALSRAQARGSMPGLQHSVHLGVHNGPA